MNVQLGGLTRKRIAAAVLALASMAVSGVASGAEIIDVTIDFAKLLKLDRAAGTIVVGNPGIADATVQDDATVVLTGKAAGTTNLIVLDDEGKEITNSVVRVSSNVQQLTTIFFGRNRQTFSCSPTCEQVILVGDEQTIFQNATQQIQTRQQFATGQ